MMSSLAFICGWIPGIGITVDPHLFLLHQIVRAVRVIFRRRFKGTVELDVSVNVEFTRLKNHGFIWVGDINGIAFEIVVPGPHVSETGNHVDGCGFKIPHDNGISVRMFKMHTLSKAPDVHVEGGCSCSKGSASVGDGAAEVGGWLVVGYRGGRGRRTV